MITIIISLFTLYKLSQGQGQGTQQYGAFGQICPAAVTGQVRCEIATDIASPATADKGLLDCGRANDCCLCGKIECGNAIDPCHTVAIGTNSAFGVRAINILGDKAFGGANVECMGTTSCAYTYIIGSGIGELACAAEYACYQAVMKITDPGPGFGIECLGKGACSGLQVELYIPPPANNAVCDPAAAKDVFLGGIECMGVDACLNLVFTINNKGCDNIILEAVHCPAGACTGARFGFIGEVNIDFCELPASGPQPSGLQKCFTNLRELACAGKECQNQIRALSVVNNFELVCEGAQACLNAKYTLAIVDLATPVTNIRVMCLAANACQNAAFMVDNYSAQTVTVSVECIGNGACGGSMFVGSPGTVFEVACNNPAHCRGCMYNGVACDINAAATSTTTVTPVV
eukprot:89671_1